MIKMEVVIMMKMEAYQAQTQNLRKMNLIQRRNQRNLCQKKWQNKQVISQKRTKKCQSNKNNIKI